AKRKVPRLGVTPLVRTELGMTDDDQEILSSRAERSGVEGSCVLFSSCPSWQRVARLVGGDFLLMLQGKADVVQSFQQAMTGKVVNLEGGREPMIVSDLSLLEIDRELVAINLRAASE